MTVAALRFPTTRSVVDSLSSLDMTVSLLVCLQLLHSTALLQNCAYTQGHVEQYRTYMANCIYRGVIPRARVLLFGVRVTAVCHRVCMRIGVRHGGVVSQNVDVRVSVGLLPVVCADCQCGFACMYVSG